MNFKLVPFLVPFLMSCASAPKFYKINPAFARDPCQYDQIVVMPKALILKKPQAWIRDLEHLDAIYDSLYVNIAQMNSIPISILQFNTFGDTLNHVQLAWNNELWFKGDWFSYKQLGQETSRILLIHRMDMGVGLDPHTLYSSGQKDVREDARDTLSLQDKSWPQSVQMWTCWTLWNGALAQYERYGCFPVEYNQNSAEPWDRILKDLALMNSWKIKLAKEVCGE